MSSSAFNTSQDPLFFRGTPSPNKIAHIVPDTAPGRGQSVLISGDAIFEALHPDLGKDEKVRTSFARRNSRIIQRNSSLLDDPSTYTEASLSNNISASQNRRDYMLNYAIQQKLPTAYTLDALFFKSYPNFVLQLQKQVYTRSTNVKTLTYCLDGSVTISSPDKLMRAERCSLSLSLLELTSSTAVRRATAPLRDNASAKMAISHDGDLLAIYLRDSNSFNIIKLKWKTPQEVFTAIDAKAWDISFEETRAELEFVESLSFDSNGRYLIASGKREFYVLSLDFMGKAGAGKLFSLNTAAFDRILDIAFISKDEEEQQGSDKLDTKNFSCFVAALRKRKRQVSIFDFSSTPEALFFAGRDRSEEVDDHIQDINMKYDPDESLRVKISSDFSQVVLTSSKEKFILERHEDGFFIQKKLYQLKDLEVHFIQETALSEKGFVFLASSAYDTSLSVVSSFNTGEEIKLPRNVEPGILKICDFNSEQNHKDGRRFLVAAAQDNQLAIDKCSIVGDEAAHQTYELDALSDLSFNWPYVAFTDLDNHIMIINSYNRLTVRRIQVFPEGEEGEICQTFITNSLNLFVLVHSGSDYKLYRIDIKALSDPLEEQEQQSALGSPRLIYSEEDVGHRQFTAMHVRGSSKQMNHDLNEVLSVFFLHGDRLFNWTALSRKQRTNRITEVCSFSNGQFLVMNESNFCFLQTALSPSSQLEEQRIMEVQVNFSTFELRQLYRLRSSSEEIVSLNLDQATGVIIMLTKAQSEEDSSFSFFFKMLSIAEKKIKFTAQITSPTLIGKLSSGLFTFVGGHIYFNNNVIKIRYDLIQTGKTYKECEIFDFYFNIFDLGETMRVRSGTPLDSIFSHRLAYFIYDTAFNKSSKLVLLPYLHDRQLFLHRVEEGTDYFYTSARTPVEDEEQYNSLFGPPSTKMDMKVSSTLVRQCTMGKPSVLLKEDVQTFNSIICVDQTSNQFSVFSQDGLLINKVDFKEQVARFGAPVAASSNGLNFVFRTDIETMPRGTSKDQFFQVHLLRMNIFGLFHIKEVNIMDNLKALIEAGGMPAGVEALQKRIAGMTFAELRDNLSLTLLLNDNLELAVVMTFKSTKKFQEAAGMEALDSEDSIYEETVQSGEEEVMASLVYFERSSFGLKNNFGQTFMPKTLRAELNEMLKQPEEGAQQAFATEDIQGFSMNNSNLFLWTNHRAYRYPLEESLTTKSRVSLKFELDEKNPSTVIKDIRTGSHPGVVVLIVKLSAEMDILVIWDSEKNFEIDAQEIKGQYDILWDQKGSPYIVLPDKIIFGKPKASIKAFEYSPDVLKASENRSLLMCGHRFDGDNHNWFIHQGFLAMPFCYMTFVIKNQIEKESELQASNVFDLEPYSYIFNKTTSFMDSEFVRSDHLELVRVLENFNELDPVLLELLHYTHDIFIKEKTADNQKKLKKVGLNSPLHIAMHAGNSMSIEILLKYMTLIPTNSSRSFASIFSDLVEFKSFLGYLAGLPVQTEQMKKKRVFRTSQPESDLIVAMKEAKSVYLDEHFYSAKMEELPAANGQFKSYPVDVVSLRIGWILTTNEGRRFLEQVLCTENLEIYKIPSIQMIVEFLYSKQKTRLLYRLVPAYLLQFFLFYVIMFIYESYISYELDSIAIFGAATLSEAPTQNETSTSLGRASLARTSAASPEQTPFSKPVEHEQTEKLLTVLNLIMLVFLGLLSWFNVNHILKNGVRSLMRVSTWLDFINLSLNAAVAILIQVQTNSHYLVEGQEVNEAFNNFTEVNRYLIIACIFLGYIKLTALFRLTDSFAPIVDQITQICFDIRHFVVVLLLTGMCFATSFYIVAHNQIQFDEIYDEKKEKAIEYQTVAGALWYSWNSFVIGNVGVAPYDYGNKGQRTILVLLFVAGGFMMMIHLLNMLIAMMGNTFNERSEVASEIRTRDHLRFVLENWHLNKETIEDMENMKYIVAAFSASKQ